ncbi:hypothetical protein VCG_002990 [Vibrio cholerae 12129(1)]|nr:hypothetical protein VCG_002990 [Vibrio cholerae 12129(1)]
MEKLEIPNKNKYLTKTPHQNQTEYLLKNYSLKH